MGIESFSLEVTKKNHKYIFYFAQQRMTNVSKIIFNSTYQELLELNITDTITTGSKYFLFRRLFSGLLFNFFLTKTTFFKKLLFNAKKSIK